ncbi:GLPGLI family protein [Chryseobacterium sp. M5]|uniref:GLPGLI family protein n=1 Tax=Chryseobacterium sp. M5 TaxID=3379128 RepID=UPI0038572E71
MISKILQLNSLFIVLLLVTKNMYAQDIRFYYDYTYVSDTIKKEGTTHEEMILEVNPSNNQSIFVALKKIKSDSTMSVNQSKGVFSFPDRGVKTDYIIEKRGGSNVQFLYTTSYSNIPVYQVEENRTINWKILNDKKKIMTYSVQKAVAKFAGREWTAWFTTEVPISEGPYKFNGLPGLIVQLYDSTLTHNFELKSIQKNNSKNYKILKDKAYNSYKKITLKDYINMDREFKKDPMKVLRDKIFRGDVFFENENEKNEYMREQEKLMKEAVSKNNNPIELNY